MIAGIELGKEYAQVCVKTDSMKEPESLSTVAGTEHYRIPVEIDYDQKDQVQELFRRLWKLVVPYGKKDSLERVVFCLEENSDVLRQMLTEIAEIYNISKEKVSFMDKKECFCTYMFHQQSDLLAHNVLLIENDKGEKRYLMLYKRTKTAPIVAEVKELSEKPLEDIFTEHAISSVFLVGDDFEEPWMQKNLKLLRSGRRVFIGKNLFVKGACYKGMEQEETYLYLGEEKVCFNIALRAVGEGKETFVPVLEGGKNWYESNTSLEILLLEDAKLEFAIIPINGKEKKTSIVHLEGLPGRPPKTTRLQIEMTFEDPEHVKLVIKDLGFGEIFPRSDMKYEGELQWEQ